MSRKATFMPQTIFVNFILRKGKFTRKVASAQVTSGGLQMIGTYPPPPKKFPIKVKNLADDSI